MALLQLGVPWIAVCDTNRPSNIRNIITEVKTANAETSFWLKVKYLTWALYFLYQVAKLHVSERKEKWSLL